MKRMLKRGLVWGFLGLVGLGATMPSLAWDKGNLADYHGRRAQLVRETRDGVVVLFGYSEDEIAVSTVEFRQNEMFYYLTGWNQPDAILLLVPKPTPEPSKGGPAEIDKEILFIPPHDYRAEKWTGPKLGPDDPEAKTETGFPTVMSKALFPSVLNEALKTFPVIYTETTPQPESGEDHFIEAAAAKLKALAPMAAFRNLRPTLTRTRAVKSPGEIALMRKAVDASVEAHLAAMKAVKPGMGEYEIAALMEYEYMRRGCEWPSYPPIVGSGFYSTVLHYESDSRQMQDGDVVVMDVAGSYSGYASDITRTLPANGHFTERQREIYEIVYGAQEAAFKGAKPGVTAGELNRIARDFINSHGKDKNGQTLGQYFIHGLSHSVGLNVHDPMDYSEPLQPGMIITVEPGIYIPEEKIGVRIEDMILITPEGSELLTKLLPRKADEVERVMARE